MKRWQGLIFCFGLALVTATAGPAAGETVKLTSAQLKLSGLEKLVEKDSVAILGFSWVGAATRFEDGLTVADVAKPEPGDLDFTILARGGPEVCEGLRKLATEPGIKKARLVFRSANGTAASFRLAKLGVERADCAAKPWSASLTAKQVSAGEERDQKDDSKTKKDKKTRSGDVGANP